MKILILVQIEVVKRLSVGWVPVAEGKVDCDAELNFAPAEDVLEECVSLVEPQLFKASTLVFAPSEQLKLELTLTKLGNIAADIAEVDVFSTFL